eukprot:TRINITY_DN17556_c0_g1_i2.p1 TRINITY_DN17556_c0_g1~~TRINITY_DN17556_c0_g1_i2.p1  ORF type:complete len:161 (-),score=4.56 TRINITY_DN17556_c0_g1_i2:19-501(-)
MVWHGFLSDEDPINLILKLPESVQRLIAAACDEGGESGAADAGLVVPLHLATKVCCWRASEPAVPSSLATPLLPARRRRRPRRMTSRADGGVPRLEELDATPQFEACRGVALLSFLMLHAASSLHTGSMQCLCPCSHVLLCGIGQYSFRWLQTETMFASR